MTTSQNVSVSLRLIHAPCRERRRHLVSTVVKCITVVHANKAAQTLTQLYVQTEFTLSTVYLHTYRRIHTCLHTSTTSICEVVSYTHFCYFNTQSTTDIHLVVMYYDG